MGRISVTIGTLVLVLVWMSCQRQDNKTWVSKVELLPSSFYYDSLTATTEDQPGLILQAKVKNRTGDTITFNGPDRTNPKVYAYLLIADATGGHDTILLDRVHPRNDWAPGVTRDIRFFESHRGFIEKTGLGWVYNGSTAYHKVLNNWLNDTIDVELHVCDSMYRTRVWEGGSTTPNTIYQQ